MNEDEFNRVDWPDPDDLANKFKEQDEIFASLPPSVIERNVANALAQFAFLSECKLTVDWPNIETWIDDPEAVLTDFLKFSRIFKKLVNYDPEIGHYFAKEPAAELAWGIVSHTFPEAVQAAVAIIPLPLSVDRLNRVVDIVVAYHKGHETETPTFDEAGKPTGTRFTWNRLTFEEQRRLCNEALKIIGSDMSALRQFVKLKTGVSSAVGRAEESAQRGMPKDVCKPSWDDRSTTFRIGEFERPFAPQAVSVRALMNGFQSVNWDSFIAKSTSYSRALRTIRELKSIPIEFFENGDFIGWRMKATTTDETP